MGKTKKTTLGAGCFWCVEAVFQSLKGVYEVISGYSGGEVENPTYKHVCTGKTGHAEVTQITFYPEVISFEDLLTVFWRTHDPTTLNSQGPDEGTQFRSVIFYHDETQKSIAERSKNDTDASGLWPNPIITEIVSYRNFYKAEDYHQNYFLLNPYQPYCKLLIDPKIQKFRKEFGDKIKD